MLGVIRGSDGKRAKRGAVLVFTLIPKIISERDSCLSELSTLPSITAPGPSVAAELEC